jgi:hypothetical protein
MFEFYGRSAASRRYCGLDTSGCLPVENNTSLVPVVRTTWKERGEEVYVYVMADLEVEILPDTWRREKTASETSQRS